METCRVCGTELEEGASFCHSCGRAVQEESPAFSKCGGELGTDSDFCKHCGASVVGGPVVQPAISPNRTPESRSQPSTSLPYRVSTTGRRPKKRSAAWIYYSILTVGALIATFTASVWMIIAAILLGLYAFYLFRGGSIVIWFW